MENLEKSRELFWLHHLLSTHSVPDLVLGNSCQLPCTVVESQTSELNAWFESRPCYISQFSKHSHFIYEKTESI